MQTAYMNRSFGRAIIVRVMGEKTEIFLIGRGNPEPKDGRGVSRVKYLGEGKGGIVETFDTDEPYPYHALAYHLRCCETLLAIGFCLDEKTSPEMRANAIKIVEEGLANPKIFAYVLKRLSEVPIPSCYARTIHELPGQDSRFGALIKTLRQQPLE